jgi:hypothetical protein
MRLLRIALMLTLCTGTASVALAQQPANTNAQPAATPAKSARTTQAGKTAAPTGASAAKTTPAPAVQTPKTTPAPPNQNLPAAAVESTVLKDTKPDALSGVPANPTPSAPNRTLDSPFTAVGDGWKMIFYLLPTLVVLIGALRLLRAYQERTGHMPRSVQRYAARYGLAPQNTGTDIWSALLGGLNLSRARERQGSNIRLIEAVPIGGANLHLIEVRGRPLLIAVSSAGVALLADLRDEMLQETNEFQSLLQATAADMSSLDYSGEELPATAVVGTLDEELRDARQRMAQSLHRLRRTPEAEDA